MGLQVKTLWLVAGILSTCFGILVILLRTRYTGYLRNAFYLWGGSCLFIGIAFFLATPSPRAALSLISPLIGVLAITMQYVAVSELKQQGRGPMWMRLPLAVSCCGYFWFGYVQPNLALGLFLINIVRFVLYLRISWLIAQREDGRRQFVDLLAAGTFLLLGSSALGVILDFLRSHVFSSPYDFYAPRTLYTVTIVAVAEAVLFVLFILAITERLNDQLKHQAMHDPLTNLFNRRAIQEIGLHQKSHSLRAGHAFTVFLIDIDNFKQINDGHGHATGDRILQSVAIALRGSLRDEDYLGRWGGDEFCALLPEATRKDAALVADRVMNVFEHLDIPVQDRSLTMSISIGIASAEESGGGFDQLMAMADEALYQAKKAGRRRYIFASGTEKMAEAAAV